MTYNVSDVLQVRGRGLGRLRVARHPLERHAVELDVAVALHRADIDVDAHAAEVPDVTVLRSITDKPFC